MTEKGTIDVASIPEGLAQPSQAPGKLKPEDEDRIELPPPQESKPERIVALTKVALARILETPAILAKEPDPALLNLHLRLHQLWNMAAAGTLELTKPEFLKVHAIVVAELDRRGMEHNTHDELDQATRRSKTRKFAPAPYSEDYYAGLKDLDKTFIAELADVFKFFPAETDRVLEVGCGTGRALKILKASGIDSEGAEVSDYAISVCRGEGLDAVFADAAELPFADELYDVVFSMDVLEHTDDFLKSLRESIRVAHSKAIHLVPLGIRRDPTHKHVFKTFEDLRRIVFAANLGQAVEFHRTPTNKAIIVVDKGLTDVSPVTGYLQDFTVIRDFLSLAGGAVKRTDPQDIDLVWRAPDSIGGMEIAFRNLLPPEVRERIHNVYNPQGPHDDHIPIYDLVAVRRYPLCVVPVTKVALKPLQHFTPLKMAGGYTQQEFFAPEVFWEQWAKPFIEEGTRLAVETKFNGYRTIAEYDGKDTLVFFEDAKDDRSEQLIPIVNDIKSVGRPVIFDLDVSAVYEDGSPVPRVELSNLISHNTKVDKDGNFTTPDGHKATIIGNVFHILYLGDEDLHELPWQEMRKKLEPVFRDRDFRVLKISDPTVVSDKSDLLAAIKRESKKPNSEGAVIKVVTERYPLTGQTTGWAKVKNLLEFKVEVIDRKPVKGSSSTWNYIVGYKDEHDKLRELGRTFNTNVDAKPGDILTLSAEEVIPAYDETDKSWVVTTVVPRVEDLETGGVKADEVKEIIRRAAEANILQVTPEVHKKLREAGIVTKAEELPELFKQDTEGAVSFKEGDEGTGILQTHERGLADFQAKLVEDFGWDVVELSDSDLAKLSDLAGADVSSAYKQAQEGNSKRLADLLEKVDPESLSASDKGLLAKALPVSVHTDFRMRPGKETYWEGGEGFTPGNQFMLNKFRQMAEGKLDPNAKILMNFKIGRVDEGASPTSKAQTPVRGPLAWMTIGEGKPAVFPPGSVGSTSDAWSRFTIRDKFRWKAGVQDKHYKEFEFDGNVLKGRWIFQFVPVGHGETEQAGGRAWMVSRPQKQEFDSEALNKSLDLVFPILKRDSMKRIVTGIVLKPNVTDAQGDITDPETIENAAHKYLLGYRRGNVVGFMHKDMGRDLAIVESYIAPEDVTIEGKKVPKSSWVMSVKVLDEDVWKLVLDGKVRGFSIGGVAKVTPLASAAAPSTV